MLQPTPCNHSCKDMIASARETTGFLKAFAHEGRLAILCRLSDGECTVTELEDMLGARQAAVSQQLSRLRLEGLVTTRRDGKIVYYLLADTRVPRMIGILDELFCAPERQN